MKLIKLKHFNYSLYCFYRGYLSEDSQMITFCFKQHPNICGIRIVLFKSRVETWQTKSSNETYVHFQINDFI